MSHDPLADFDGEIYAFLESAGVQRDQVQLDTPAQREFGERAIGVFRLAKERRQNPQQIAAEIAAAFDPASYRFIQAVEPAGKGFVNFRLNYSSFIPHVVRAVQSAGESFGRREAVRRDCVVVEHTSVNPNKEWHIGHVRNAVLGDVIARLLSKAGHDVQVQNYIDDTGPQAAQAVFAMETFPEPHRPGEKYDHYSGRVYVKVAAELGAEKELENRLRELPASESAGDGIDERVSIETRLANIQQLKEGVVATMRHLEEGGFHDLVARILSAQLQTAFRLGIFYDLLNWESHLVQSHAFQNAIELLQRSPSVFWAHDGRYAGALVIQTGEANDDGDEPKAEVLIRSNGIPTYVGKDIAYHMWKFHLLPDPLRYTEFMRQPNGCILHSTSLGGEEGEERKPNRVINVIGVHQNQAQETVKEGLRAAGFAEAADDLFHLAYGLVSSAAGRISGRKGTSVSGDAVIDQAVGVALDRVREKRSMDLTDQEMQEIAEAVGVGAVRYFMVQYNPLRDIVFDVADVVSYDGNTALYIQYALVRMFAILRRAREEHGVDPESIEDADTSRLQHEQERRLVYQLAQYPETVATASRTLAVNLIAEYAFDLATIFSQFYRDCGVLNAEPDIRDARLLLVRTVRDVLVNVCGILGVPVIERL